MPMCRIARYGIGLLCWLACAGGVLAQPYPSAPIRLVVGYPPGGANDIIARQFAPRLGVELGTQVVVENKGGANAILGAEAVARATPDGYTLLFAGLTSLVFNTLTYPRLPYDAVKDFEGIGVIASNPVVFAVRPSLGVGSLPELVALAKGSPGKLNFATVGAGGSTRVWFELLKSAAQIDLSYVPYKGGAQAITDLMGNQVDGIGIDLPAVLGFVRDGKLRAIAVTGEERHPLLPEVGTAHEQGLAGLTAGNWYALLAPAGTPAPILQRLDRATRAVMADPGFAAQLLKLGVQVSPQALAGDYDRFLRAEMERWAPIVRSARIQAD